MSRDQLPTRPEGISAVGTHLTMLWMEIGDHGVYQIGRRAGSDTCVYLRGIRTIWNHVDYLPGVRCDPAFILDPYSIARLSAQHAAVQRSNDELDELLGEDRPSRVSVPSSAPDAWGTRRRLPYEFVGITSILTHRNMKRLRLKGTVSLPPNQDIVWLLELVFPNLPNQPRVLRPAVSDIIPPGL